MFMARGSREVNNDMTQKPFPEELYIRTKRGRGGLHIPLLFFPTPHLKYLTTQPKLGHVRGCWPGYEESLLGLEGTVKALYYPEDI